MIDTDKTLAELTEQLSKTDCPRCSQTHEGCECYYRTAFFELCVVHDMAEAIVGDITPSCGVSQVDKYNMEKVR